MPVIPMSVFLVVDITINNHWVEAVVDSGAQVSILSRIFYDSLSCRPGPVESIRMKGVSASGIMIGCRVDGMDVDLGDGNGNYSMTIYVVDITDNCILGLDYLKAREAVIDLIQGVVVVVCHDHVRRQFSQYFRCQDS